MPGLGGFEVVEALTPAEMPLIVFVTAYDEYALAAFEANAVAYLLKPVVEDRLQAVVARVEQLVSVARRASRRKRRAPAHRHRARPQTAASRAGGAEGRLRADPAERGLLFPGGGWRDAREDGHRQLSDELRHQRSRKPAARRRHSFARTAQPSPTSTRLRRSARCSKGRCCSR